MLVANQLSQHLQHLILLLSYPSRHSSWTSRACADSLRVPGGLIQSSTESGPRGIKRSRSPEQYGDYHQGGDDDGMVPLRIEGNSADKRYQARANVVDRPRHLEHHKTSPT
jgi:hypothetical protein